ncbi:MAG: A24 family peptidase [Pyrinomonadaceae bacterium]
MFSQHIFLFQTAPPLLPTPLALLFIVALGAVIGSFLNVVIHRLPHGESIVFPNSRCPNCQTAIRAYDNVPVLAYLWLGGKCRACKTRISPRYPLVEALTAALFALVFFHDGLTLALPFDLIFVASIVALIFIDAEHMILPNAITYPGFVFALIARFIVPNLMGVEFLTHNTGGGVSELKLRGISIIGGFIGASVGGGLLWLVGFLWEKLRGVEAMGMGDVKMLFYVGAFLGWQLTLVTIFLAVFSGAFIGIALMLKSGSRDMQMRLPFGIFLGIGAIIGLLYGTTLISLYLGQFAG